MAAARPPTFKALVLGDVNVGKTSLITRYIDGVPPIARGGHTIGVDFKIKRLTQDGVETGQRLFIWDLAGSERFRSVTRSYYRGANAIVLVYDVTDRASFEHVEDFWMAEVNRQIEPGQNVKMVLVGTKADLSDRREVTTEEGQAVARHHGMDFCELSSMDNNGADAPFDLVVAHCQRLPRPPPPAPTLRPPEQEAKCKGCFNFGFL